jgi:hypothetical protein
LRNSKASLRRRWVGCTAALLSASACCLSEISGVGDGGLDAGRDAGADAGFDAGPDAGDAGPDAGEDAGPDAGADAGQDAGADAGEDAGVDAGPVGAPDAGWGVCGAGSELTSYATYATSSSLTVRATADMNGDGVLDLVGFEQAQRFDIWFGLADGGFGAQVSYAANLEELAVGDENGDGYPDVIGWTSSGLITVLLNDGKGDFSPAATVQASNDPGAVAVGDLNGDGLGDLVVSDRYPVDAGCGPGCEILYDQLQVFLGEDAGFAAPFSLTQAYGGDFGGLAVADLNGDGLADIVSNTTDQQKLIVLLSEGDGGFESATYGTPVNEQILLLPNGTRTPDLVLHQSGSGAGLQSGLGFAVLHNRGDGTFDAARTYAVVGLLLAIGDFNGDCVPDIATTAANDLGCEPGWGTSVLYGDGDGGFGNPQFLPAVGGGPYGPFVLGRVSEPNLIGVLDFCGLDAGGLFVYGGPLAP